MHTNACTYTNINTHTHAHTHIHTNTSLSLSHTHTHTHTHTHPHTHPPIHEAFFHLEIGVIIEEVAQVGLCANQNNGSGGAKAADLWVPDGPHIAQGAGPHSAEAKDDDIRPAAECCNMLLHTVRQSGVAECGRSMLQCTVTGLG